MTRLFAVLLISCFLTTFARADQNDAQLPDDYLFFRQPTLLAPKANHAFKADGVITDAERAASAEHEQFITFEADARGDERVTAYLAHTGKQFYVGFQVRRATRKPIRADITERDNRSLWGRDDGIELRIFPTNDGFDFVGNSIGVTGDAKFRNHSDQTWNSDDYTYASRQVDGGWEGEFLFDAAVFGIDEFGPGEPWRIDIFNAARTDGLLSGWGYLGGLWRYGLDKLPLLVFGDDDAMWQQRQTLGQLENQRAGLDATINNPTAAPRDVKVWAAFYRLKEGEQPQSYYGQLKGVLDPGGIEILPGATYEQLLAFAVKGILETYTQAQLIDETQTVPANGALPVQLRKPDIPGQYLTAWRYEDAKTGRVISAGVYPFSILPPVKIDFEYHYLVGKKVIIKTLISDDLAAQIDRMTFAVQSGDEVVATHEVTEIPAGTAIHAPVPTADWPAGDYTVLAKAMSGDTVVTQTTAALTKPEDPFWWQSDAGKQIKVSWPWTPVDAKAKQTNVWGRTITWGDSLLPQQIESRDRNLLTQGATAKAIVDGSATNLTFDTFNLESNEEDAAVYRGTAKAGNLTVDAKTTVEFDGMTRFDWTFSGNAKVDQLFLEFPIDKQHAELVASYMEKIEKSGLIGHEPTAFPFTPSIVVRNSYVGLEWFAECEQYWSNADDQRMIELIPQDDTVLLRIRVIDKPKQISEPFTLTFGLIAWPVKPWPEKRVNYTNYVGTPPSEENNPDWDYWDDGIALAKKFHCDMFEWFHWNALDRIPDYPEFYNDEIRQRVIDFANIAKKHGVVVIGHTGYALPTDIEDFEYYGMEMVARPLVSKGRYGYVYTHTPAYIDAYVARYKKIAEETGFSGLQSDGGLNVRYGENLECGFGWYDENGKLRGRWPIFATRELTRRLYNVFHGEVDFPWLPNGHGHITLHTYYPFGACHGFLDSIHTGESRRSWGSFHTLDIDTERAVYPSRSFGLPLHCLPKLRKATHGGRGRIAFAMLYGMNPCSNRLLDHLNEENYNKHSFPAHRVWDCFEWIDAKPERFHGYWENERFVTFDQKDFRAAVHLQPGRKMLLSVINWLPDDRTADVRVNLENAGFDSGDLKVVDAITDEAIDMDGGHIRLDVAGDAYRLLKIWKP